MFVMTSNLVSYDSVMLYANECKVCVDYSVRRYEALSYADYFDFSTDLSDSSISQTYIEHSSYRPYVMSVILLSLAIRTVYGNFK